MRAGVTPALLAHIESSFESAHKNPNSSSAQLAEIDTQDPWEKIEIVLCEGETPPVRARAGRGGVLPGVLPDRLPRHRGTGPQVRLRPRLRRSPEGAGPHRPLRPHVHRWLQRVAWPRPVQHRVGGAQGARTG